MTLEYVMVDVFAELPLAGNQLAVFPDAPDLPTDLMQGIARELNLSETTFVTASDDDSYSLRIFTSGAELPFAGHPTLGTAWVLKHLGKLTSNRVTQNSAAGTTSVTLEGDRVSLSRTGSGGSDIKDVQMIADLIGVDVSRIGSSGEAFGKPGARLNPSIANAGLDQLMVPLQSVEDLVGIQAASVDNLEGADGTYCYTIVGSGKVKARFFAGTLGVSEDPATGSAATGLGHHLGDRLGDISFTIEQGTEISRPSSISVTRSGDTVHVSGRVILVGEGLLQI